VTDEVLARVEYRANDPGLLRRIYQFILEWIGRALDSVVGAGRQSLVGTAVVLVITLVIVVLLLRFVRGVRRDPGQDPGLAGAAGRSPGEWRAEAEQHERAGRWREALRSRYRLLLALLAAHGLIEEVPGRTSGEYLAEAVASLPAARQDLRDVTLAFERVWYGGQRVDGDGVRAVAAAVDRIDAVARGGRVPVLAGSLTSGSASPRPP
jgi:hypothetical protein